MRRVRIRKYTQENPGSGKYLRSPIRPNFQQLVCHKGPWLQRPFHHWQGSVLSCCLWQGHAVASPLSLGPWLEALGSPFAVSAILKGGLGPWLKFLHVQHACHPSFLYAELRDDTTLVAVKGVPSTQRMLGSHDSLCSNH